MATVAAGVVVRWKMRHFTLCGANHRDRASSDSERPRNRKPRSITA